MKLAGTFIVSLISAFLIGTSSSAENEDPFKLYIFGNSLIHHLSDTPETTVPYWLSRLAEADGRSFEIDGEWGFLRNFSSAQAPKADWRIEGVTKAWSRKYRNFDDVKYDAVMINPANFIQYDSPQKKYNGDNPTKESPLSATIETAKKITSPNFVIYEGWADLHPFARKHPPSKREAKRYHEYNIADYHDWYVTYHEMVQQALPETSVDLIPVAKVLGELVLDGPLKGIPAEALYSDLSPHGTETLYFLAAAITYVGLLDAPLPEAVSLPDTLHADLRSIYPQIRDFIHSEMGTKVSSTVPSSAIPETITAEATSKSPTPGLGIENPSMAIGLTGISDWSTQTPFIDLMKSARPWVGHLDNQWGALSSEKLEHGGFLDEHGWVWGIPPGIDAVESVLLTDFPEEATSTIGRYRLTYDGAGELNVTGRGRTISKKDGEIWFEYRPGPGLVGLRLEQTDPMRTGDYIHNIRILREDHIELYEAGAVFNPDWLQHIADMRLLRFMDWSMTNNSNVSEWSERPLLTDFSYAWRGVPTELMTDLGNTIGSDIWVNVPHKATNDYTKNLARLIKSRLSPDLKVYVEYSNELWNFVYQQTHWAGEQARNRWGENAPQDAWIQFAGMRAAEVARVWDAEFGESQQDQTEHVISVHTGWKGLEEAQLEAPLWMAESRKNEMPVTAFDAYAVTGYFGIELGTDERANEVLGWINESMQLAITEASRQGLKRAAQQEYVRDHLYDAAIPVAVTALTEGSLKTLIEDLFRYHGEVATQYDMSLIMYEGGTHVVGVGEWTNDEALTNFFSQLNYSPEMGALYDILIDGWRNTKGATAFNAFVDLGKPSRWGSWGHLRHLDDKTPRFDALSRANAIEPTWGEGREEGAFLHGGVFRGSDNNDQLFGTHKQDFLIAGGGDDILVAMGDRDNLHGGPGYDIAEIPGEAKDYEIDRIGKQLHLKSGTSHFVLVDIEALKFGKTPNELIAPTQLE